MIRRLRGFSQITRESLRILTFRFNLILIPKNSGEWIRHIRVAEWGDLA